MSTRTIHLPDALHAYLLAHGVQEPDPLRRLREHTATLERGYMQISPEQGQFMRLLVQMLGARLALEVGVFTGYSALCVALALPPDGKLVACDVNAEWTAIGQRYWQQAGVADRMDLRLGPALTTLDGLIAAGQTGTLDFAFIDADKTNATNYYQRVLELLRPGGVVMLDNAFRDGDVADPAVVHPDTLATRAVTRLIFSDPRVVASIVPIGDGVILALKRR